MKETIRTKENLVAGVSNATKDHTLVRKCESKFIKKEEFQKLALDDLDIVIQKQPTFAVTYNIRAAVKKVMGIDYCEDLKMFCNLTQNCEEYKKKCGDESKK